MTIASARRVHGVAWILALAYTGVVLALTLSPGESDPQYWLSGCLICGAVGTADALKNVVFFVPLGAFLALAFRGSLWAALPAALLSVLVESLQFFVPGRDASPGDLVFNSLGALMGVALVRTAGSWLTAGRPMPGLAAAWTLLLTAILVFGGWAQRTSIQVDAFSQQWTPEPTGLEPYAGRVLAAWIGQHAFVDDDLDPAAELEARDLVEALEAGEPIRVIVEAGQHRPNEAAILRAQDRDKNRIFQVGAKGWDLLVGVRTRTSDARLFEPDQLIQGALAGLAMADTADITLTRSGDVFCARVDGVDVGCGRAVTLGRAWRWLEPRFEGLLGPRLLDTLTVLLLFFPLGFWGWGWKGLPVLVFWTVAALVTIPLLTGLGPSPWWEWGGAASGLILAIQCRRTMASAAGAARRARP